VTTPNPSPPVTIPVFNNPAMVCPQLGANTGVFLQNLDPTDNLFIGYGSGITAANTVELQPGSSTVMSSFQPLYAYTDSPNPPINLLVSAGTSQFNIGPAQIAEIIDLTGLATATALAILQTGISLVAEPVLLYGSGAGTGGGGGSAGTNIFGSHVDPGGYGSQFTASDWIGAANFWNGVVGAPIATQQIRWYYSEGQYDLTLSALTANAPGLVGWINGTPVTGPTVIISYRPKRVGVIPGGTLNSTGTTEAGHLATALAMLKASFPGVNFLVCLWHEPQGHDNSQNNFFPYTYTDGTGVHTITYVDYIKAYGPTVTAAAMFGFAYICLPSAEQVGRCFASNFWTNTNAENYTHCCADYYGGDAYKSGVRLNSGSWGLTGNTTGILGPAVTNGLILGLTEWSNSASGGSGVPQVTYSAYVDHIIAVFSSLAVAQQGGPINWYQGGNPGGPNIVLANGSNTAGVTLVGNASNDGILAAFNALSVQPVAGGGGSGSFTIPGGGTVTPAPILPSPGGGYALANGLSYDISIIGVAGAASTIPFVTAQMKWKNNDVTASKSIHEERWTFPLGQNGSAGTIITGRGPMHGKFLAIHFVNRDTDTATIVFNLNQTGRPISEHDWQWDAINSVNVPTFTLPGGSPYANSLGQSSSITIPAAVGVNPGQASIILSLFAGDVDCRIGSGAPAGDVSAKLTALPSSVFGTAPLFNEVISNTAGQDFSIIKTFPRTPLLLTLSNSDTGGTHTANASFIALDRG
jgi:hypothetical protein